MTFRIKTANSKSDDVALLSDELHKDLELIYGKGLIESFKEENDQMLIFYVAYDETGNAVGCGALRHFDETTAEIKRMYIKENFRGQGISKKILMSLENYAIELNYQRIVLETGLKQPEAMNLYASFRYKQINCYGWHADDPDSRCFEKIINIP